MVTEQLYWKKSPCGWFCFICLWLLISIMNRCVERWVLQFYRTFLIENKSKGFIYADIIRDKTCNVLVPERLVERRKGHFDSIIKIQLPFGLESREGKPKALSIVKVDRQIFVTQSDLRCIFGFMDEWHTGDIRVRTSDIQVTYECIWVAYLTYEYIQVTYGWHTRAHEWHEEDISVTYGWYMGTYE